MKRRNFVQDTFTAGIALSMIGVYSCKSKEKQEESVADTDMKKTRPILQLSLAQWSMHRMINDQGMNPYLFAEKAKEWGFAGLEYVSQLYEKELKEKAF